MNEILYLEGAGGISGDMTVAALLDLGASREKLDAVLASLRLDGFTCEISRKNSYGIAGCDFDVRLAHHGGHHDHDHNHDHDSAEHAPHSPHQHRNLDDVLAVINRGALPPHARDLAEKIFRILAEAEARAHACPVGEVHFHEVGAVDSIVDIVAAATLLDDLQVRDCIVCGLTEGTGTVRCAHGELPVPVPAVAGIAAEHRIPLRPSNVQGERITPTGAAIAAAVRTRGELPARYRISRIGIGLGKRDFGIPNFLRAMLLQTDEAGMRDPVVMLECNIDDSTGEALGLAMDKLMAAGARDVHCIPCFMKKNRPGYLLRVICEDSRVPLLERTVFETTSTIGLRKLAMERTCMAREVRPVTLSCGEILVKRCVFGDIVRDYPEYESVKRLSETTGLPCAAIWETAARELPHAGERP